MAELEQAAFSCCDPERQVSCCEPDEKQACCAPGATSCGCSAGRMSDANTPGAFALDGLTPRLNVIGVPLETL